MVRTTICPLKQDEGDKTYECFREKCEWWTSTIGRCAVAVIALDIGWKIAKREY